MSKKHSIIPPLNINNQFIINNKNNQIPRPKNNIPINPIVLYKKGRNYYNNNSNNNQYDSCMNDNENIKRHSNNTIMSYKSNSSLNKYNNIQNECNMKGIEGIFDLLSSLNKIKNDKNNISTDINENNEISNIKEKIEKNISNKEVKDKLEHDIIEDKIIKAKKDMDDVKKNIEKLNKKMIDMKNTLEDLKLKKIEKKKQIENFLSNKETLEEMYNMEILFIKNENKELDNCNLNITIEEIKQININLLKMQVIELIKELFGNNEDENNNNSFIGSISNIIMQAYYIFIHRLTNNVSSNDEIITEFFVNLSEIISKENKYKYSISTINSLLHYLIKINCINQKIEEAKNFIKKNYKLKKQDINQQLIEITLSLIFFENKKHEILTLTSKLKEQLKQIQNSNKDNDNNSAILNYINENDLINDKYLKNKNNVYEESKDINININKLNNSLNLKNMNINKSLNINMNKIINNAKNNIKTETKEDKYKTQQNDNYININIANLDQNRNDLNGGNIEIRYDINNINTDANTEANTDANTNVKVNTNMNLKVFSEKEETKNKIYENYINNGIALNDRRKRKIKKLKFNFNSKSGNISKEKDKNITNENNHKNYSTCFNYNFNTNFMDMKINKKYLNHLCGMNSERKNTLILKNNFDTKGSKIILGTKKTNSNNNLNGHINVITNNSEFNEILKTNNNDYTLTLNDKKNFENKNINLINKKQRLKYKNFMTSQSKLRQDKTHIRNSESFLNNHKKKINLGLSNFQKYLARSITNSSLDFHDKYKSMNNINKNINLYNSNSSNNNIINNNNSTNKDIFKSFHTKKNVSNIIINDFDNNVINNYNYNSNSYKYNKNSYTKKSKANNDIDRSNININKNLNNYCKENRIKRISNYNFVKKRRLKLSNNSCTTLNSKNNNNNIRNNTIQSPNDIFLMSNELDNQLKIFKQGEMESFCYFKIIDKKITPKIYNPLNDCAINPEYLGYNESYISIDVISGCLKISPKIHLSKMKYLPTNNEYLTIVKKNNNNEFYINIKLEKILGIKVEKYMQDIIKIQNILMKYNNLNEKNNVENDNFSNNIRANKIFSINKILNKKEINEIKMEQNEKIKAALCNFFSFSFSLGNRNNISNTKIDLIFINFGQFNIWLNTLSSMVKNNVKSSKINLLSNYNSDTFQKMKKKYNAKSNKKFSETNYKKIFNINLGIEKIRTKSNIQSNNIKKASENNCY
jgi:hypothetical protein